MSEVNLDQEIIAQKEALDKAIAESTPLVSKLQNIEVLKEEFKNDPAFLSKVNHLATLYSGIRRTRPDGNCFYRALGFRYFETISKDEAERKRFRDMVVVPSKDTMEKLGFPKFTVEDFYDNFLDALDTLKADDDNQLWERFNDQGSSDYTIVFLRLLTSMHLQENADFFQNFMEEGIPVKDFCATDVEPMYVECDNIQVTALTATTGIKVRIMYLDRGDNKEASPHDFPEDSTPAIHLLYRPGHYDILYPK